MYCDLSKEAKKQLRLKYEKTKRGKDLSNTLNRLLIEGIILIVCFVVMSFAIVTTDLSGWYWLIAILTIVFAVIFLVGQYIIRKKEYNNFFNQLSKTEKNKLTK
ncbi:MAG: hypothetical protein ACI4XM_08595 [Candidatus Coprovivens sp.]